MKSNLVENTTEWTTLHSQLLPLRLSQSVSQFTFHCRENVRSSILVFCFAVFAMKIICLIGTQDICIKGSPVRCAQLLHQECKWIMLICGCRQKRNTHTHTPCHESMQMIATGQQSSKWSCSLIQTFSNRHILHILSSLFIWLDKQTYWVRFCCCCCSFSMCLQSCGCISVFFVHVTTIDRL